MRYIQRLSWNNSQVKKKKSNKIDNKEKAKPEESIFWKLKINDVFIIGKLNENSIEIFSGDNPNLTYGVNSDGEVTLIPIEINNDIKNIIINNIGEIKINILNEIYYPGDIIDNWKNFIEI